MPRSKLVLVFAVVLLALSAGWLAIGLVRSFEPRARPAGSSSQAPPIGGPYALPATTGGTVTDQTYRGKWKLIYFGYTFCPDACPTALNNISEALKALGPAASRVQPLFITVDPKRDTLQVMTDYLKAFDPRIVGLTGTPEQISNVATAYHVYVAPEKKDGNDYLVDHSAYLYVMTPTGTFVNVLDSTLSGEEMAAKLREVMGNVAS